METVIQFQNACKQYGEVYALQPLTLDIAQGEFLSVVGSSGGGKTTLLKLVNGLLLPTSGKVLVMGQDTAQVDLIQLRRQIGYVIQGAALFPHLSVADNISYVPGLSGQKLPQQRLEELMKLVDLPADLLHRYPISLSGGQQQRVGIARALASQPRIMLMDEPFGAVDEITRTVLQDSIQQLHQQLQTTILFVTHNIREALRLSDRVLIINHGQVQQLDTPENILAHPANEYVERLLR
ncbi:MAG: ATP-binding cassette domain-containing protein [Peptococcaceae bacterium]|nr:ATP-binding cassette domain-containing protein [Peptococcaceae bacterium]